MSELDEILKRIDRQGRHHRTHLWIAAVVVVASILLMVRYDGRVAPRAAPQFALPESCPSKFWFGVNCPGCGLTRSFVLLAAGQLAKSFEMHRVGWLLALAVLGQFPYRLYAMNWLKNARQAHLRSIPSSTEPLQKQVLSLETIPSSDAEARGFIEVEVLSKEISESTTSLPWEFQTPLWVEVIAKLLIVALIGNWLLGLFHD